MGAVQILVSGTLLFIILIMYLPQVGVEATWGQILASLVVLKALSLFLMPAINITFRNKTTEAKEEEEKQ